MISASGFKFYISFSLLLFALQMKAQVNPAYSKEVEENIKQVENNLGGWVKVQDSPSGWNLLERMKYYNIRGLSLAVVHNYKIEWARAYGWADQEENEKLTSNTRFLAGSVSKSLNAVGILLLAQQKKLDLYKDINLYLRTWKFPYDSVSKGKKISTANLLSHTAGLSIHGFPGYAKGAPIPTLPQILDGLPPANTKPVRSEFEPGLKYQYSGGGVTISQLIMQDVTGESYAEYMDNHVLKPMGMMNSTFLQPGFEKNKIYARGYNHEGRPLECKYFIYPEQAAAGLWTTPTDLSTYIIETQMALAGKSSRVLNQEMTRFRLTPYIDKNAAMGVFMEQKGKGQYFGHGGSDQGFLTQYYGSMEGGNGVVVMINTDNGAILNEIINSVAMVYHWEGFYSPVIKKTIALKPSQLEQYTGNYLLGSDTILVTKTSDQFWISYNHLPSSQIIFTSAVDFFLFDFPADLNFTRDKDEKVTGILIKQNGREMSAKKIN